MSVSVRPTGGPPRRRRPAVLLSCALLALSACSVGSASDLGESPAESDRGSTSSAARSLVRLVTHDSWNVPEKTIAAFEQQSGYRLRVLPSGDAGVVTNKLVLTQGAPIGDVAYGVDNSFADRAVQADVFAPYAPSQAAASADDYALSGQAGRVLTPVDWGDVCVNVDLDWFADRDQTPPQTLEDLTRPAYQDLFVTPGAATSSPGFAFLLATVAAYGDTGWADYWQRLLDNGARVVNGWNDAYEVDFSANGGDRPIVLSYNSSPPFTIPVGSQQPTTKALLETCYRQIEYVGVLSGAKNPAGAQAVVDFLASPEFQAILPESMYVFPVDADVTLPPLWSMWAEPATEPYQLDPAQVDAQRDTWIRAWSDLVS